MQKTEKENPIRESFLKLLARLIAKDVETRGLAQIANKGPRPTGKNQGPKLVVKITGSKESSGNNIGESLLSGEAEGMTEEWLEKGGESN